MLRSAEQNRARYAWECIKKIKKQNNEELEKKYNSYVKKALPLIQNNGLGNALAFYKTKFSFKDQKVSPEKQAYKFLYEHINQWFQQQTKKSEEILEWIISEDTSTLKVFQITKEMIALINWLKRFAEAELKGGDEIE